MVEPVNNVSSTSSSLASAGQLAPVHKQIIQLLELYDVQPTYDYKQDLEKLSEMVTLKKAVQQYGSDGIMKAVVDANTLTKDDILQMFEHKHDNQILLDRANQAALMRKYFLVDHPKTK